MPRRNMRRDAVRNRMYTLGVVAEHVGDQTGDVVMYSATIAEKIEQQGQVFNFSTSTVDRHLHDLHCGGWITWKPGRTNNGTEQSVVSLDLEAIIGGLRIRDWIHVFHDSSR